MTRRHTSLIRRSIRRHLVIGLAAIAVLVGGIGGWATTTEISGAVIAAGRLVVETDSKKVQHPTGGVVAEITVRNDDHVDAGELLVRLDETQARAQLAIIDSDLDELVAQQARLEAERDGAESVVFPDELLSRRETLDIMELVSGEQRLFDIRRTAREGRKSQLWQQILQLKEEIRGIEAQKKAKESEIVWTKQELEGVRGLWKQNLVQFSRVTELERSAARLDGERGSLIASAAQAKRRISEIEIQILQIDQDFAADVASQLADIRAERSRQVEKRIAVQDELTRTDIRAPSSGRVHQLAVHTVGGVIQPGETIMLIVPDRDALIVEVRARPQDIDQLSIGQVVSLLFTSFNRVTTPQLTGKLTRISPDVSIDERSGAPFYTGRVTIEPDEIEKLGGAELVPGMPVEAFIQTAPRSVLSYLIRPLSDRMQEAFRED
jgi:HlyD family secretion protein